MAWIAIVAALLALARDPYILGFVVTVVLMVLFVASNLRRGDYGRITGLVCGLPTLPLLTLYVEWWLATRGMARRSSVAKLDGILGASEIALIAGLMAYVLCVSLAAGGSAGRTRENPGLKLAAWRVVLVMPISWGLLLAFTLWDPLGVLGYLIR